MQHFALTKTASKKKKKQGDNPKLCFLMQRISCGFQYFAVLMPLQWRVMSDQRTMVCSPSRVWVWVTPDVGQPQTAVLLRTVQRWSAPTTFVISLM